MLCLSVFLTNHDRLFPASQGLSLTGDMQRNACSDVSPGFPLWLQEPLIFNTSLLLFSFLQIIQENLMTFSIEFDMPTSGCPINKYRVACGSFI